MKRTKVNGGPLRRFGAALAAMTLAAASLRAADYGGLILHPPAPSKTLKESVADAARVLGVMTGHEYSAREGEAAESLGIVLARADGPGVPDDLRERIAAFRNPSEGFVIRAMGPDKLLIVSGDDLGLSHGLYTYLASLGARWYLPGEDFEIIPRRPGVAFEGELAMEPDFRSRWYFPTGAFGVRTPVDPDMRAARDNEDYKRRNRWGGAFLPGGHDWDAFVGRHKEVFLAHPEYLALYNGERVPVEKRGIINPSAKLCVSNPAVAELYAQDRIEQFRRRPAWPMLSIEPSDGGGFCECPECAKIGDGSPSDQTFYLANEVAKRVAVEFPDKRLSLLAYHLHAAPPSFPIEPNVFVQVAPYAFQSTAYAPGELLRAWGRKLGGKNLGVYDYWILPDSNRDMPDFNFLETPRDRIRFWKEAGCDSFMLETTFGAGPIGLALYLTSQLAWDAGFDTGPALDEFYAATFGPAAAPMRELMELWARHFEQTPQILGASFQLMNRALDASKGADPSVRKRVLHFANYLQFVRLYYEYRRLSPGDPERSRLAREAVKLLWRMHPSRMVHTFRVQWMIRLKDEEGRDWLNDFDMRDHSGSGWAEVMAEGPVTEMESLRWVRAGVADYGARAMTPREFSGPLVPMFPDARPAYPPLRFETYGYTRFVIDVPEGMTSVTVRAANDLSDEAGKGPVRMQWFDNTEQQGQALVDTSLDATIKDYVLPVARPGLHELLFLSMARAPFQVELPGLPLACVKFTPREPMNVYFLVPKGVNELVFKTGTVPGGNYRTRATDPQGREVPLVYDRVGNAHYFSAKVPPGASGVWCLPGYRNGGLLEFITVPQAAGFAPDGLLAPRDALAP